MSQKRSDQQILNSDIGTHHLELTIKGVNLLGGSYFLSGELWDNDSTFYVGYANKRPFTVYDEDYKGTGVVYFDSEFKND